MSGYTDLTKLENSRNCLRRIARHDEQQFSKDSIVNVMEKFVKTVNAMDETILVPCRLMDMQVGDSTDIVQAPAKTSASHQVTLHGKPAGKVHKKTVHEALNSADLFNLYTMLNALKKDLLWTRNECDECEQDEGLANAPAMQTVESVAGTEQQQTEQTTTTKSSSQTTSNVSSTGTTTVKGHNRRPSTASMTSTNSVSNLSDSESELSNENDSGIESEGNCGHSQKDDDSKTKNADKATELAKECRQHLTGLYRCLEQMTDAANYLTARYQSDIGQV